MQTGPIADRITAAAHSFYPTLPIVAGQYVVKDTRLRDWSLASDGLLGTAAPLVAKLNGDGDIVRVRTLEGSPYLYTGTLDIQYATPADSLVWSGNTITQNALYQGGVDIWVNGNTINVFWVDADAVTIKTAQSLDGGHTWGSASTVVTLSGQGLNVLIQLTAPQADTLIYTDSTIGADSNGNPLTGLYVVYKVSGTWQTPVLWDLGGQPLGVESRVTLPNTIQYPSNLSSMVLSNGSIGIAFYSKFFRESFEAGIWLEKVYNLDLSVTSQHLQWAPPYNLWQTVPIDDDNNSTQMFASFPRLQPVGDEFWVVALESSQMAGHQRYHLGFWRSTNGVNAWSDRNFRQGAAYDSLDVSEDTMGAYAYDDDQPFLYTDLIYANLIVTAERTFIVGYDRAFWCPSTALVGVDNPDRELDLTDVVYSWDIDLPQAPSAGQATYNLASVDKSYDANDILAAHRGVVIEHKAGYNTDHGDELVTVGTFQIDSIKQETSLGSENGVITALDNTLLMDRYKSPLFWEFFGPQQLAYPGFCDTTPFNTIFGTGYTSINGNLKSGVVTSQDNFQDNTFVLNADPADGAFLVTRFRCTRTWTHNRMGVAFEGRSQGDSEDNKRFWVVFYNKQSGKWSLHQAIPRVNQNRVKLYKYKVAVQTYDAGPLNPNQSYWFRVGVYHGHVMAWYTTNNATEPDPTWIKVIDYVSPASPAIDVLPCRIGWWALLGTARTEPSGALGNLSSKGGMVDLSIDGVNPKIVALHVQMANTPSILRRVNVALTQENTSSLPMPDANIILVTGDADSPFDMTDEDNIIFQANASALFFGAHDSPAWKGANDKPNPRRTRLDADEHVWIAVSFNDTLTTGQSYKYAQGDLTAGNSDTKKSTDGGVTWSGVGEFAGNMTACIEVEYLEGLVKFSKLYFGSAEPTYTIEDLAHELAAKSEVLDISPDDFLNSSELELGADLIDWQPISYGKIGTFTLDADIDAIGTPYTRIARLLLGSSTIGVGDTDAYIVDIDPDTQLISYYTPGNVLVHQTESLQHISDTFHVRIVNQNNFVYVYINEALASNWYMQGVATPGYIGIDSIGAIWSNLRIPDLTSIVEYFALQGKESSLSALQRLVAKPAPNMIARGRFFIRYDGSLRISTFSRQQIVDQYYDTLFSASKEETQRNDVSHLRDEGNYYADRFDPTELDTSGVIFDERDYTDARFDTDAYDAAAIEFQMAKEQQILPSFKHTAVFTAEREDKVNVLNPLDHTDADVYINGLHLTFDVESTLSDQDLTPRLAVTND